MTCAETSAVVAVKVLVKLDQITPIWILLKPLNVTVHRPASGGVTHQWQRQSLRNIGCNIPQRHHRSRARWKFNLEVVAKIEVKPLKRLDQQEIDRKPDRTAPIRV